MCEHVREFQKEEDGNGTSQQMLISKMDKKQIFLPVETWVDILLCISRIELAKTVSLTNWLFNAISRPRIDEDNKRIVNPMRFINSGNGIAKLKKSGVQILIAQVPPPICILGFKRLNFCYINDQILEFMRIIKPILGTNVYVNFCKCDSNDMSNYIRQLCDIIKGNISGLYISMHNFNLLNMEFLKTIQFVQLYGGNAIYERIFEWMHSPLDGNKSRYISMRIFDINEVAEICKTRFLESTVPVSFIFRFDTINDRATLFSIENETTGEQLTLGWFIADDGRSNLMLFRSKIGDDQGLREVTRNLKNEADNRTRLKIDL